MTLLESAIYYANRGLPIFPLAPGTKVPLADFPWKNRATTDPDQLRDWFEGKTGNFAVKCGAKVGDLYTVVLDIDVKPGRGGAETLKRLEEENEPLPPTHTVRTPSGGFHLTFVHKTAFTNASPWKSEGIDVRGRGGYVAAPGSTIAGRNYDLVKDLPFAVLPEWIASQLTPWKPKEIKSDFETLDIPRGNAAKKAAHYLEYEAPPAIEGNHGDDTTFMVACKVGDMGVDEKTCLDLMAYIYNEKKCLPPWDPVDLKAKVASAYKSRRTPVGSTSPQIEFSKVSPVQTEQVSSPKKRSFQISRVSDLRPNFNQKALVKKLIDPKGTSVVFAEPNAGKSWFALELAYCVATGSNFLGLKTTQVPVLYVVAEGDAGFKKRLEAYRKERGFPSDIPFFHIAEPLDLLDSRKDDVTMLIEAIQATASVGLVIIDTLARVMGRGDENKAEDMNALNASVARIAKELGAHVMLVHHAGKDSTRGARGHSSLRAAIDTEIKLEKGPNDVFVASVTKQRDMEYGPPLAFKLERIVVGEDADGDLVDSCVVVPAVVPASPVKLKPVTSKALDVLKGLAGVFGDGTVVEETWRKEFWETHYADATYDSRKSAFRRAKGDLLTSGLIEITDGKVTLRGLQ